MEEPTMNKKLYQFINKDHLDPDNKLSNNEWLKFVELYEDVFAEETSELAYKLLLEYKNNNLKYNL
jgi:hypothetical protein